MIDTNLVLIIAGILTLLLIGLILVSGSKASSTPNAMTTSTNPRQKLGAHGMMDMEQPKCVTIASSDITGLAFYNYDARNSKVLGQLSTQDNTVELQGSGAILITNLTENHIEKMILSIKANDSPINNIWIYKKEVDIKPLALNPGNNMPYFVDLPQGSSVVLDVGNISRETKVTVKVDSVLISP